MRQRLRRVTRTARLMAILSAVLVTPAHAAPTPDAPDCSRPAVVNAHWACTVWWRAVQTGTRTDPMVHFANPSQAVFAGRVRSIAAMSGVRVVEARLLRVTQAVPYVIVRSNDRRGLARSRHDR